jgi:hypothetical protein
MVKVIGGLCLRKLVSDVILSFQQFIRFLLEILICLRKLASDVIFSYQQFIRFLI